MSNQFKSIIPLPIIKRINMEKKIIHNLTILRLVVGYLGEKNQYSWWSSSFLTENSKKILEFTFPRTASIAQYEGVSASAAKIHDQRIGVGKSFHLFRLPEYIEKSIVHYYQNELDEESFVLAIRSKEEALDALTILAGTASISEIGPVNIGVFNKDKGASSINKIAASYLTAFNGDKQIFPYFMVSE